MKDLIHYLSQLYFHLVFMMLNVARALEKHCNFVYQGPNHSEVSCLFASCRTFAMNGFVMRVQGAVDFRMLLVKRFLGEMRILEEARIGLDFK